MSKNRPRIFCPKCGQEHTSTKRYCKNCGNDLEEVILRFKQKYLPIKYNGTVPQSKGGRPQKSGVGTAAIVFGILTILSGVAEILVLIFADWSNSLYITLSIIFGLMLLISFVTVSVLSNCCCTSSDCSGCTGCDCGGCGVGDCASGCGDCAGACDGCSGCDISC